MAYKPDPPPSLGADQESAILKYVTEQLARVSIELESAGSGSGIPLLTKEPTKKEPFQLVAADGTQWNPGNGRGIYFWDGSWIPAAVVPPDPVIPPEEEPPPPEPTPAGTPRIFSSWESNTVQDGLWSVQQKATGRASVVSSPVRHGSRAVRLRTLVGDNNVNNSGNWERCDLNLGEANSRMFHGAPDEYWAHSMFFPDDFHIPTAGQEGYLLMDIHDNYSAHAGEVPVPHQANYNLEIINNGQMRIRTYGGDTSHTLWLSGEHNRHQTEIGAPQKNIWYDFVHFFRWRNNTQGITTTWLRKGSETVYTKVYDRQLQPNLYLGLEAYLKLANYHGPYGVASSIIHDRVISGPDWASVALAPAAP